jgi:hypothetical protein
MRLAVSVPMPDHQLPPHGLPRHDQGLAVTVVDTVSAVIETSETLVRSTAGQKLSRTLTLGASTLSRRQGTCRCLWGPAARCPAALVYELLDAHADTAELAAGLRGDPRWGARLEYLRELQRAGSETLARGTRAAI